MIPDNMVPDKMVPGKIFPNSIIPDNVIPNNMVPSANLDKMVPSKISDTFDALSKMSLISAAITFNGLFVTCRFVIGGIKAIYRADTACFGAMLENKNGK